MSNSLAKVHPELVSEWAERNFPLTPDDITYGSNKRVWWKGSCGHEWQASVKARSKGEGCPICSGARVVAGINDFATINPRLVSEWSEKNTIKPTEVTVGSHKKVIWKCEHGHEWTATVKSRTINNTGCPYCSHNKVLAGFNDLASQFPQIAAEWSDRNYPLLPTIVTAFANSKAWWKCKDCGHEWYTLISTRSGGSKCPYCSGYTLLKGFNDLATTHPQIAEEWSEKNFPLTPETVNHKSRLNVWWRCKTCGYEWKSVINARVKGTVCPVCADRAVLAGYNDLATTDKELLSEWDYEKNNILPTQVSRNSMRVVWWKCSLGHSWRAKISDRTARKHLCQFAVLKYQQMDGLNTVMPFGTRKIDAFRTLTTESLAVFIPFRVQDIYHENGIYYGQNVISKNMIIADRKQLLNGNEFILGVSGGGKSFAAKNEIINLILSSDADVIIIDPEREYSPLVKAMGGQIINISATSPNHINAMDMNKEYGDGANPVILKSEFIMSLCEQLIGGNNLGAKQKSIIDRCTASVYRTYQQNDYQGTVPTLQDFRDELLKQDEPEAKEIALAIELFTHGSLNTFAKPTNVDTNSYLICYDILDLGKQLMPIGMLVVLDSILNRITQNRAKGKKTFIFIDEIYLLFQHEYSANFLFTLWKRVRKYGAYASGITQNVDDLLQSHTARTMLANSEFIIMLNQAATDRIELAKLLNISDLQMSYITNVEAGHGLIKVGSSLVPFVNKFPTNTQLYKLMTTKPGEGV